VDQSTEVVVLFLWIQAMKPCSLSFILLSQRCGTMSSSGADDGGFPVKNNSLRAETAKHTGDLFEEYAYVSKYAQDEPEPCGTC
jgi:hypothetical protein